MPRACCVRDCKNVPNNGKTLFGFPKNEEIRSQWVKRVCSVGGRGAWTPRATSTVCEDHFTPDCFIHDIRLQHLGFRFGGRKLKAGSVPTVFQQVVTQVPVIKMLCVELAT